MTHQAPRRHRTQPDSGLDYGRPTRARWRAWTTREPALDGLSWHRFHAELRDGTADRQDELLAALVRVAQRDPAAVAVMVACLLPGLCGLVARHAPGLERSEALAVAVAGLCESIARYRPDGTPVFVASRLLRLPKRRLRRAVEGEDAWLRHRAPPSDDSSPVARHELSAATCLRLAVDAGVLSPSDAWLIHVTRIVGHSLGYAAGRLDIGYEAAKKRRQRAEARWGAWWDPDAAARRQEPGAVA